MPRLEARVGSLTLENPVMNASGIMGSSVDEMLEVIRAGAAAVVTKSFTREPREGNPTPVIVPVACGYVNSVGLRNPGAEEMKRIVAEVAAKAGKPVVVSIAAADPREAEELTAAAVEAGAAALELNLSCPHAKGRGLELAWDDEASRRVVEAAVAAARGKPVWVKVGYVDRLVDRVARLVEAGASAIVAINTLRAMKIDVYAVRPVLGGIVGGLSGRAIHPVAVRAVYEIHCEHPDIPLVGVGGVYTWLDAAELILAGASAIQIGTALFDQGLDVIREVLEGLEAYLERMGWGSLGDAVGAACKR